MVLSDSGPTAPEVGRKIDDRRESESRLTESQSLCHLGRELPI